ncbi:MAG: winged helix-turn-helix domain-containing protein [Desulfobacterales bacterium]|nr:winged helix-turn-helix domain-containing protein [Desulfobacterales bacterium]
MLVFEEAIKKQDYKSAEKQFLKKADELVSQGAYDIIRNQIEAFPESIREKSILLTFYYSVATHLIFPFETRRKLSDLVPKFIEPGDIERAAIAYITLLMNYLYYDDKGEELLDQVESARLFVETYQNEISSDHIKLLKMWMKLGRWWEFLEREEAFEIGLEAEEIALTLGDDAALIFSRIALTHLNWERGRFRNAMVQLEKIERLLIKSEANRQCEPLFHYARALTHIYMHSYDKAEKEVGRGLEIIDNSSVFQLHLLEMLFYCHLGLKKFKSCEQIIENVLKNYPDKSSPFCQFFLFVGQILLAYRSGDKDKVRYYCDKLKQKENIRGFFYEYPLTYLHYAEASIFIEDYETVFNTLDPLLGELSEDKFSHAVATCHALLGVVHFQQNEKEKAQAYFDEMNRIVSEKGVESLEIVHRELLVEVSTRFGNEALQRFTISDDSAEKTFETYPVAINSLGQLEIFVEGKNLPDEKYYHQGKVLNLLSLLIVNRKKGIPREVIFDLLWEGHDLKSARNNLNVNLSKLRKIIGQDFISSDGAIIRLTEGKYWLDVDEFENNLRMGKKILRDGDIGRALTHFKNAAELYKGKFMTNDPYTDFVIAEREALSNKYFDMLFNSIKLYLDQGDYFHALAFGKKLIQTDLYSEPAYRLLMIASTLSGNRSDVPILMKKLTEILTQEFDIEPDDSTKVLAEKLVDGTVPIRSMWENEQRI